MAKQNRAPRSRNIMYEQQLSHLPNGMTHDELYEHILHSLKPKRIAMILHDKDKKNDGCTPQAEHIHIMLEFENARSVKQIAHDIGDEPQYCEIWDNNTANGFSYLIHATENARLKHQYSCDDVRANFDYVSFIASVSHQVTNATILSSRKIDAIMNKIATGEISYAEAKNRLSGSEYARYRDKLAKAHELFLERTAEKVHSEMMKTGEKVEVHWLYGESETGKTHLATKLAKDTGLPFFLATTSTDPFQYYQGESIIILDELRPGSIKYSELLVMFNPFSGGKVAISSRYSNKYLSCKTFFITTPYDPVTFYQQSQVNHKDNGEQLYRRLSSVLKMDMDMIYKMEFDISSNSFCETERKANLYSKKHQKPYELRNIFNKI